MVGLGRPGVRVRLSVCAGQPALLLSHQLPHAGLGAAGPLADLAGSNGLRHHPVHGSLHRGTSAPPLPSPPLPSGHNSAIHTSHI
ncbi:unnamed protein product [Protopolystoma xenopodis]|uniref:Uncharacterized protein n=1 Tax=Protopolystoma xenopodis TaxID=117903 RepID=A0A448X2J3_9PLAT|nr:unnamed protein product [Protopolystoma xenopodis]